MKERFTRNMGYVIVLFIIAMYFVISYLFIEGFNDNPIVSILDGILISIGTIVSTISMANQGIINGKYSEKYQSSLKSHLIKKQEIVHKINRLQDWLDEDYYRLMKMEKTTLVNSAGFEYEEVFGEKGKVLDFFKIPKPAKLELKTKKERFFGLFYKMHYYFYSEEWKYYRERKRFVKKARRYNITRLTVNDVVNINTNKDPNDFGSNEAQYLKKKSFGTVLTRLFMSFGLPFIAFAYHDFSIAFFIQQLVIILMMIISSLMSMFFAFTYMVGANRDGVIKKTNKLEEFKNSNIFRNDLSDDKKVVEEKTAVEQNEAIFDIIEEKIEQKQTILEEL